MRILLGVTALWLFVLAFLALMFWPHLPTSPTGWVAFVILGPPLYMLGELISETMFKSRAGRYISEHPSQPVRILLGVLVGATFLAISMWASWKFGLQ